MLAAVLFTDMVNSTAVAGELGDRRFKALTAQHHRIVRRELRRFNGREVDTAGDGFFATFREPAKAIACACAVSDAVQDLGIEIRAGIHFGECEQLGKKPSGITVVVGSRIMALGGDREVLVSGTVADLTRGSGFGLTDRGLHQLKGVGGEWRVFAVDSVEGIARRGPLDATEAARRRAAIPAVHSRPIATWGLAAVVGAGILIVAAVGLRFWDSQSTPPRADSVARISQDGTTFVTDVSLAARSFPDAIAWDGSSLWVANVGNSTLVRIDPESGENQVLGTPSAPTGVAAFDGTVWVSYGFTSNAGRRLDVVTAADGVLGPASIDVAPGSYAMSAGGGALWVADYLGSTVVRHDLASGGAVTFALPADSGPTAIDIEADTVWVAAGRRALVFKVDGTARGGAAQQFSTGRGVPAALAISADGTVWIVEPEVDAVVALDPSGTTRVDAGVGEGCDEPSFIAPSGNAIWVSCSGSANVVRLDPTDGSIVASLPVQGNPGPMAVDSDGGVWVAIRGAR
jgi:sugar lactone lactonase YvrE